PPPPIAAWGASSASSERAASVARAARTSPRAACKGLLRESPSTEIVRKGYPAAGTSCASARSPPMNVTLAPSARSASATASAGITCPAVPPAAITILFSALPTAPSCRFPSLGVGYSSPRRLGVARWAGGLHLRASPLPGLHSSHVRGPTGGDVEQQPHRRERDDQAARPVGDEGQRHPRERREPQNCEHVEQRLGDDQGRHPDSDQGTVQATGGLRGTQSCVGDQAIEKQQREHSHDSELLTDHGQDEVCVSLRQVEDLLHRLAGADPEQTARADRYLPLH